MRLPRDAFLRLAEQALREIPGEFRALFYNLEIGVKALPGPEAGRARGSRSLLGLYQGPDRHEMLSPFSGSYLPPRILLYQRNLEAGCSGEEELLSEIRTTLRHEIAHHLGFSEARIRKAWPQGA
jgi:predicted Zn-dependent protease with MMP-like domain